MKPLKVFYNGKFLREIYPHATKWQVFKYKVRKFFRKVFIVSGIALAAYVMVWSGARFFPSTVYATQEKQVFVNGPTQVMERIAKCESGGKQFGPSGQVLVVGNVNKSVDMGKYQINISIWGSKATELGFDLTTEKGNTEMAYWLYANYGTEPWVHTKSCWNK